MWLSIGLLGGLMAFATPCYAQTDNIGEWRKQMVVRLSSNKRFPPKARGESGTAIVGFVIDRTGGLVSSWPAESTGIPEFDQEALAVIERSQPFPAPPSELDDDQLVLRVPLNFAPGASKSQIPMIETKQEDAAVKARLQRICRGC